MVVLSSVAIGPLVLMLVSALVAGIEKRAEARVIVVAGIEQAPTLRNYLERQTYTIKPAPADYEQQLKDSRLGDPVVVMPPDFEAGAHRGEAPLVEVVTSAGNQRAQAAAGADRCNCCAASTASRRCCAWRCAAWRLRRWRRCESRSAIWPIRPPVPRSLARMLPFFVLMAVLYGALNAALDTTAGERERGSLEPLLMNPAPRTALVLGKWGAVASVGMLIAVLSLPELPAGPMVAAQRDVWRRCSSSASREALPSSRCCCRWRRRWRRC